MNGRSSGRGLSKRWNHADSRRHEEDDYYYNDRRGRYNKRDIDDENSSGSSSRYQGRNQAGGKDLHQHRSNRQDGGRTATPAIEAVLNQNNQVSQVLKTLLNADDPHQRLDAAAEFQQLCTQSTSVEIVYKYSALIISSFEDILHNQSTPSELKQEVSTCLGYVGKSMGRDGQTFFNKMLSKAGDEKVFRQIRIYYFQSIAKALSLDASDQVFQPLAALIMNKSRDYLESTVDSDMLMCLVQIIGGLKQYHHVFKNHFKNVVDILVGWLFDSSISESVAMFITETLISLKDYWLLEVSFSMTLLEQFVEDIEAYIKELDKDNVTADLSPYIEPLTKVPVLCRVFGIVVKCISITQVTAKQASHFVKLARRIIDCGKIGLKRSLKDCCLATNDCLVILNTRQNDNFASLCEDMIEHAFNQLSSPWCSSRAVVLSVLKLIDSMKATSMEAWVSAIADRLDEKSQFMNLISGGDMMVSVLLLNIYTSLITDQPEKIKEQIFKLIIDRMNSYIEHMKVLSVIALDKSALKQNITSAVNDQYNNTLEIERSIVFYLQILSIKEMMLLKKRWLAEYFLKSFDVLHFELGYKFPMAHFSLLYCIHDIFQDVALLQEKNNLVLPYLCKLLTKDSVPADSRKFCLTWTCEIVTLMRKKRIDISDHLDVLAKAIMSHLVLNNEVDIRRNAMKCIHQLINLKCLTSPSLTLLLQGLQTLFGNTQPSYMLLECLQSMPLDIVNRHQWSQLVNARTSTVTVNQYTAYKSYMNKISSGTLSPRHFHDVMNFMLYGTNADNLLGNGTLRKLFHYTQGNVKERTSLSTLIDLDHCHQWFWCVWEAAQFCVASRLRTPLGKAQADTFQAIEGTIREYATEVDTMAHANLSEKSSGIDRKKVRRQNFVKKLRIALIIQFFDCLEKLMYNAYEGFAATLAPATKPARLFFRTNRPICQDWLARLRRPVSVLAFHAGYPAATVQQGFYYLNDVKNSSTQGIEFEQVTAAVSDALCQIRAPDAVRGLKYWIRDTSVALRLPWIGAGFLLAQGKLELAAKEYRSALKSYIALDQPLRYKIDGSEEVINKTPGLLLRNQYRPDSSIVRYLVDKVTNCYVDLSDWEECESWCKELDEIRNQHSDSIFQDALVCDPDKKALVEALMSFDAKNFNGAIRNFNRFTPSLATSAELSEDLDESCNPSAEFSRNIYFLLKRLSEYKLESINLESVNDAKAKLLQTMKVITASIALRLRTNNMLWLSPISSPDVMLLKCTSVLQSLIQGDEGKMLWDCSCKMNENQQDISLWLHTLRISEAMPDFHSNDLTVFENITAINVQTARIARKQCNFRLTFRLLHKAVERVIAFTRNCIPESLGEFSESRLLDNLMSITCNDKPSVVSEIMSLQYEAAKYFFDCKQENQAIHLLIHSAWHFNALREENSTGPNYGKLACAKSLIAVAKRLQNNPQLILNLVSTDQNNHEITSKLEYLFNLESKYADCGLGRAINYKGDFSSQSDSVCGKLFHLSCIMEPTLSKSWFCLAAWCYRLGRKTVDQTGIDCFPQFIERQEEKILSLLPTSITDEERHAILTVLAKPYYSVSAIDDELNSDIDEKFIVEGPDLCRRQLKLAFTTASDTLIDELVAIWHNALSWLFEYYKLSVAAYFKYLRIASDNSSISDSIKSSDNHVICTLRLLRLLVKYSSELSDELDIGFKQTPVLPWKDIIPQLFSRLNHPETYVRSKVCQLLCEIAQESPHSVIYPVVVGHATYSRSSKKHNASESVFKKLRVADPRANSGAGDEGTYGSNANAAEVDDAFDNDDVVDDKYIENQSNQEETELNIMEISYGKILDYFVKHQNVMLSEVQGFVQELRRITLLWEELWLGTLAQYNTSFKRRVQQIEGEIQRIMKNKNLNDKEKSDIINDKHTAIMKPIVYTLEQIYRITSQPAETTHEKKFQEKFAAISKNALNLVKSSSEPGQSFSACSRLYQELQQYTLKHARLHLPAISPKLCSLKASVVPLPGLDTSMDNLVTIHSIQDEIVILPTKTKPKKIRLLGNNGKVYTYLYKGLEDLHLDERIMQFISIINKMLARAEKLENPLFRARNYAVIPLGLKSGLIQWVDGATALYLMYKRWQLREIAAGKSQSTNVSKAAVIAKPTEMYYSKLKPLLEKEGLSTSAPRSQWPRTILRRVFDELTVETPGDMLAKELWSSSIGCADWWELLQSYTRSMAVTSMIGYIIGLGDRHLDNILIDLATGEVVHIDYNVCFEKGKSLRVSESVPFRLTNNMTNALGITRIEGSFRASCEHVLKIMRQGRESLLTLLEAFVYDPLVDWTSESVGGVASAFYGGGATTDDQKGKKEMEREVTARLYSSTVAEIKAAWLENGEHITATIVELRREMSSAINFWLQIKNVAMQERKLEKRQAFLIAALNTSNHPLINAFERIQQYQSAASSLSSIAEEIRNQLNGKVSWQSDLESTVDTLVNHKEEIDAFTKSIDLGVAPFTLVIEFLQSISKTDLIELCQEKEGELLQLFKKRRNYIKSCVDAIKHYGSIISQIPTSKVIHTINNVWITWLKSLLQCRDLARYNDAVATTKKMIAEIDDNVVDDQTMILFNSAYSGLRAAFDHCNTKVKKAKDRKKEFTKTNEPLVSLAEVTKTIERISSTSTKGRMSIVYASLASLCNLADRSLVIETTLAGTEDIADSMFNNEDWSFEKLHSSVHQICQYTSLIQSFISDANYEGFSPTLNEKSERIQTVAKVYDCLQELTFNFKSVILSESVKLVQMRKDDVLSAVDDFEMLLSDCNIDIEKLLFHLIKDDEHTLTTVDLLRTKYSTFRSVDNSNSAIDQGQMLFAAFDGLFTRLDNEYSYFKQSIDSIINVPNWYNLINVVKLSKKLMFDKQSASLEGSIFFVKRLIAMRNFFRNVKSFVACTNLTAEDIRLLASYGNQHPDQIAMCLSEDHLWSPIKHFVADFMKERLLGQLSFLSSIYTLSVMDDIGTNLATEVSIRCSASSPVIGLNELMKYVLDYNVCADTIDPQELSSSIATISQYERCLKMQDDSRQIEQKLIMEDSIFKTNWLQLARFQWLHASKLMKLMRDDSAELSAIRSNLTNKIQKSLQNINDINEKLTSAIEECNKCQSTINQKLRWTAGANPSVAVMLNAFQTGLDERKSLLTKEDESISRMTAICNTLLYYDSLRSNIVLRDSMTSAINALSSRLKENLQDIERNKSTVTLLQESLGDYYMALIKEPIGMSWVQQVLEETSLQLGNNGKEKSYQTQLLKAEQGALAARLSCLHVLLDMQKKLRNKISELLESIAKDDGAPGTTTARSIVNAYKIYGENMSTVMEEVEKFCSLRVATGPSSFDDISKIDVFKTQLKELEESVNRIHSQVTNLAMTLSSDIQKDDNDSKTENGSKTTDAISVENTRETGTATSVSKFSNIARDPQTGKVIQARNSYAVNVWCRVKVKLDGRGMSEDKKLSVSEQVDKVLHEAIDPDNLCMMYEGWTPWV